MAKANKKKRARRMPKMPERELHVDTIEELEDGSLLSKEENVETSVRTFQDDAEEARRRGITPKPSSETENPSFVDQFMRNGAEKHEIYRYISQHTGDIPNYDADDWIQTFYVAKVQGTSVAFFIALILSVGAVIIGNFRGTATIGIVISYLLSFVVLAAIIVFVMVWFIGRRVYPKIAIMLDNGRDPETYCYRYLAYLREKNEKDVLTAIANYSRGLRWQGRWKDARALFESYIEDYGMLGDPRAQYLHHALLASCAFDQGRLQALRNEIVYMKSVPAEELDEGVTASLETLERLEKVLSLEHDGKRQEAYELVESFYYSSENVLRVALALHLGTDSDNRNDAVEWINFVVQMGCTTWCVKRAKAIRAAGQLQKLPAGESRFGRNIRERRREEREKKKAERARLAELKDAEETVENEATIPR